MALLIFLLLSSPPSRALEYDQTLSRLTSQRAAFGDLMKRYQADDGEEIIVDNRLLADYPLYVYLERQELDRRLKKDPGNATDAAVKAFMDKYDGLPVAYGLRRQWLNVSAAEGRWDTVDQQFREGLSVKYHCLYIQAQKNLNVSTTLVKDILKIWSSGSSRPKECDPLFDFLKTARHIDQEEILARWKLAIDANNFGLAKYLAKTLAKEQQQYSNQMLQAQRNPEKAIDAELKSEKPNTSAIVYAIQKLAARDSRLAAEKYQIVEDAELLDMEQFRSIKRSVALGLAWDRMPDALTWLDSLHKDVIDDKVLEWRARAAIWANDWARLRKAINALPDQLNTKPEWQYWYGRALLGLGKTSDGKKKLHAVADDTSYHAYLAADYLKQPYALKQEAVPEDRSLAIPLEKDARIIRARELFHAQYFRLARNEWRYALKGKSQAQLRQAAKIAQKWQWHSEALIALARGNYWRDMTLRYPQPHHEPVAKAANKLRIDPDWIWSIMRTESLFASDAQSRVGARGLMQLMPGTAKLVAKKNAIPYQGVADLYEPPINISLGSHYLKQLLLRYQGHLAIASAAYNAGPNRVDKWLPENQRAAEEWVANIPINETRRYIQRVLKHMVAFEWRANQPTVRVSDRLQPLSDKQILVAKKS